MKKIRHTRNSVEYHRYLRGFYFLKFATKFLIKTAFIYYAQKLDKYRFYCAMAFQKYSKFLSLERYLQSFCKLEYIIFSPKEMQKEQILFCMFQKIRLVLNNILFGLFIFMIALISLFHLNNQGNLFQGETATTGYV